LAIRRREIGRNAEVKIAHWRRAALPSWGGTCVKADYGAELLMISDAGPDAARLNILYLSCHEVLEWDDLRMFTTSGHRVFSVGTYSSPDTAKGALRPPLEEFFHPGDWQEFIDTGCSGRLVTKAFARHFDLVIVNHFPEWIADNLAAFSDKPIVYRSIGQSIPATEGKLASLRRPVHVVRCSHRETDVRGFLTANAVIYFGKYKDDYPAWTGGGEQPITFYNNYVARDAFCGPRVHDLDEICADWPCHLFGRGNAQLASWHGCVDYDEQRSLYRDAPAYMYVHSLPASYLLNLIEAMAVGIPILAPDFSMLQSWHGRARLDEQAFSRQRYEVASLLDSAALYSCHKEAREKLNSLRYDESRCRDFSVRERNVFSRYFDAVKIAQEWSSFLRSVV
jgi:hypothetical protein